MTDKDNLQSSTVTIPVGREPIYGDLTLPASAKGIVIFAHGSGSSRHSPRNKYVAEILNRTGFGTLLIDLLTIEEERVDIRTADYRFNTDLLADRLLVATDWATLDSRLIGLSTGYFGASTGAAAALIAATKRPSEITAIVSRGGRVDLADDSLSKLAVPTLFIVGEFDRDVLELNQQAALKMRVPAEISIVAGATHLFEEEGALEEVASLASLWFERNLTRRLVA